MKRIELTLSVFFFLLFFSVLSAIELINLEPQTIRTPEKVYVTTGSISISSPIHRVRDTIENVEEWKEWMLHGLDGSEKTDRFLLVYIIDLLSLEENTLEAVVDFRFLPSFGEKARLPFSITRSYNDEGFLSEVTARLRGKNILLESAEYTITISEATPDVLISYIAKIRFKGFFDFFVSSRSYRNTIEWYLEKIIDNFIREMQS